MKSAVAVIFAIAFFGAINCQGRHRHVRHDHDDVYQPEAFEELEDGLEPSLKELRAAVDAAWELEKRKEEVDIEKRADDDSEELMAMVDATLAKLSARQQQEAESARQQQEAESARQQQEAEDMDEAEMMEDEAWDMEKRTETLDTSIIMAESARQQQEAEDMDEAEMMEGEAWDTEKRTETDTSI